MTFRNTQHCTQMAPAVLMMGSRNRRSNQWEPGLVSARTGWGSYLIDTPVCPRRRHVDDIGSRQVNTKNAEATSVELL
ncbi:hypothetical protein GJ496_003187 [Pomphorhynchus laevis]|nr:hypothetical protein GJ496_003187 [Pomphorhynchus laevis]